MPDDTKPGFENPEEHNKKIAETLKVQGAEKVSTPEDFTDTGNALDKIAAEVAKKPDAEATPDATPDATPEAEDGASDKKDGQQPTPEEDAAKKAADEEAAKKAATEEAAKKKADDLFKDTPSLPPNASPKSAEAFAAVKIRAAQEISTLESKLAEAQKKLSELEEKAKNPVTPELQKEIEELRNFRTRLDIEADPKFKEFDKTVSNAQEFIYAQLRKSPHITDAVIDQIKKLGGPEKVNMDKIFEAVNDPAIKRHVEAKLADIEMTQFQKEQAVKVAKENVQKYVSERQQEWEKSATAHQEATRQIFNTLVPQFEWLKPREKDEEHNKFVSEINKQVELAMKDDSPEMRATLLAGTIQLFNLQRVHAAAKAQVETLSKENAELKEKLEKIKKSSTSRLADSAAPPTGDLPPARKPGIDTRPATEALDDIYKKVMEDKSKTGQ